MTVQKMIMNFSTINSSPSAGSNIYIAYMCNLIAKVPLNYGGVAFCLGSVI